MTATKSYNGWSSYETWNVALWIDNDQGSYRRRQLLAQDAWDEASPTRYSTREESAVRKLADSLKSWIEDESPDLGSSLYSDLLSAALSEVNWGEIATNFMEEVEKEEEEEEESE